MRLIQWIENSYLKITLTTIIFISLSFLGFSFSKGTDTEHNAISYILMSMYLVIISYDYISFNRKISAMKSTKENEEGLKTIDSEIDGKNTSDIYRMMRQRIEKEIFSTSMRAYINLVIAVFGFFVSIIFFSKILESDPKVQEMLSTNLATITLPRISIIVFIEIIVLFFLRMYKSNLDEVKYYQNELTNIDFKILSIINIMSLNDNEAILEVYKELIKTERNLILNKEQTTVSLEQMKEDLIKIIPKKS